MSNLLRIKNEIFGEGKPVICVPVVEKKKDAVLHEISNLISDGVSMIEWRVDAFEQVKEPEAVMEVLEEAHNLIKNTVFLFTFRSKAQGGLCELETEEICALHRVALDSQVVDLIDIEYMHALSVPEEIPALQKMGAKIVISHHDFLETPSSEEIQQILEEMESTKADIVKLAVMPNAKDDVKRLLGETLSFHIRYPDRLLITISMGELGKISRTEGERVGSCVTFGAGKNASAPGQIPYNLLRDLL